MKRWSFDLIKGIRCDIIKNIKDYSLNFKGVFDTVILFGSIARNEYNEKSDIDILITSNNMTSTQLVRSKEYMEFILGLYRLVDESIEFDIVSFGRNELRGFKDSLLYQQIMKDGVVFYDKEADVTVLNDPPKMVHCSTKNSLVC